jgi:hypothetical protein
MKAENRMRDKTSSGQSTILFDAIPAVQIEAAGSSATMVSS